MRSKRQVFGEQRHMGTGESSYEIQRDGDIIATQEGSTYVDTDITAGSSHIYRVRAVSDNLWSHRYMAKAVEPVESAEKEATTIAGGAPQTTENVKQSLKVEAPAGVARMRVHFEQINIPPLEALPSEAQFDRDAKEKNGFIDFYDDSGKSTVLSGAYPNGAWTPWVSGKTFQFDYTHPSGMDKLGFKIDRIEFVR